MKITTLLLSLLLYASTAFSWGMFPLHMGGAEIAASEFEIGLNDVAGKDGDGNLFDDRCYAFLHTASASGTLDNAYAYTADGADRQGCVVVASDDGDGLPDVGDAIINQVDVDFNLGSAGWASANLGSGSVTSASDYWVVVCVDDVGGANLSSSYSTSADQSFFCDDCNISDNVCDESESDLGFGSWSTLTRTYNTYVTAQ